MKSPLLADVDYIHRDPPPQLGKLITGDWRCSFGRGHPLELEIPLAMRRERHHHTLEVDHFHQNFFALYLVRGGHGIRVVNGSAHSMVRGDVFLMSPLNAHCYRNPVDLTLDAVYFGDFLWDGREWDALRSTRNLSPFLSPGPEAFAARGNTDHLGHLSPEPHALVEATLASMRRELRRRDLLYHLSARARLFALLVQLADWRAHKTFSTRPARGDVMAEVLAFCESNFHNSLSVAQLAERTHFSCAHFCDVFTYEVGMPPATYIRYLRLQYAQKLLGEIEYSVADVARMSGFSDSTQLGRAFKKSFGMSPLAFRKRLRAG